MFKYLHLKLVTLLALVGLGMSLNANANGTLVNGLYYTFSGTNATVTYPGTSAPSSAGSNDYSGDIVIPATVESGGVTYNVTAIGDNAFTYATITSIVIPEGVTSVGKYALRYCTSIKTLVFPNSLVSFGRTAVGDCTKLESIIFGNGAITFSDNFGRLCGDQLATVYFNSATPPTVATYFFNYKQTLTIYVPAGSVEAYEAKFPKETYPNFTFTTEDSKTSVEAGTKFEVGGIYYIINSDLKSVTVTYPGSAAPTSGNNSYTGNIEIPATVTYLDKTFDVTAIGNYAFQYSGITSITLPEGLISIGNKSIYSTQITSLVVPNSVTTTDYESFGYNTLLESVTIGENLLTWGDKLFYNPSGKGKKKEIYYYTKTVPTLLSYTFAFAKATVHVYPIMVDAFTANTKWTEYSDIVGDLPYDFTYEELQTAISSYEAKVPSEEQIGTNPGLYTNSSVQVLVETIASAKAVDSDASTSDINNAYLALDKAYKALAVNPLVEGIYYITSKYRATQAIYIDATTASTQGLKIGTFDSNNNKYYFRLTCNGGNWNIQSVDNDYYFGTSVTNASGQRVTATVEPEHAQIITSVSAGLYTIKSMFDESTVSYPYRNYASSVYAGSDTSNRIQWIFTPAEPGKFIMDYNLENSRVRQFVHDFEYAADDASKVSTYNVSPPERRDQPNPAIVSWNRNASSTAQKVTWSLNDDFADATVVEVSNSASSYEIYNLIPNNKYYYKVTATVDDSEVDLISSYFTTSGQVRMLNVGGVVNVRDFGGWNTASGSTIAYGKIFRGAKLEGITEEGKTALHDVAGIRAELDLRSTSEVGGITTSYIGDDVEFKNIHHGQTWSGYEGIYNHKDVFKKDVEYVFSCVKNKKPVYFHCTLGADRTGALSFLLEGLLGVSESDLYKDYELTTFSGQARTKAYPGVPEMFAYIKGLDGTTLEDKFNTYFTDVIGISAADIKAFKEEMLVTAASYVIIDGKLVATGNISLTGLKAFIQDNEGITSIDLSGAKNLDVTATDLANVLSGNILVTVPATSTIAGKNIINDGVCDNLVLIDEADFAPATPFTATSASYTKTGLDGKGWYTAVLPYAINVPEGMTAIGNAIVSGSEIRFDQINVGEVIEANTPFIYKTAADAVTFEASNANITAEPLTSGQLKGTYTLIPAGEATGKLIINADGSAFATATERASIPAFRAYLDQVAGSGTFKIVINNDLTGVASGDALNRKTEVVDVCTIDGKVVRKQVDSITVLQGLPSGIYVVNGTKIKK